MTSWLADLCARTVADSAWGEDCIVTSAGIDHPTRATRSHKEETGGEFDAVVLRSTITVPFADVGVEPVRGDEVRIGVETWAVDVSFRKNAVLSIHLTRTGV